MLAFSVISHPRYKYRLDRALSYALGNYEPGVSATVDDGWAVLNGDGWLTIAPGYAWDGASGPALDTINFARPSLIHDALYQLIAAGKLPRKPWKLHADRELYDLCRADGMGLLRAEWVYRAVRMFGGAKDRYEP